MTASTAGVRVVPQRRERRDSSALEPVRLIAAPARPAAPSRIRLLREARTRTGSTLLSRLFSAGWPLKFLLVGFPLWWVLGLSTLIFPLLAVPMLMQLRRAGRIALPPGFILWALFLAWQLLGLLVLGVSPPGTHPGSIAGRVLSLGFTATEYAGVTITLLYVGNLPRSQVSQTAIARWMGWFFLTVCAGGFLGAFVSSVQFKSVTESLLPRSIAADPFVQSLVHPVAAQVQNVVGTADARPAAPFGYTNTWGNAVSILLIWFVAAWVIPAVGWRRVLWAGVAVATIVPVTLSLNRGLWIGIVLTVVWLLVRQTLQGRVGIVLCVLTGVGLAAAAVALSPAAGVISSRLGRGLSDNIRGFVANLSIVAAEHSPIVGYGGTRHSDGSPTSIAIGKTPDCARCGDVATGSTGQLWSVLFNQGVVGALLYFGFFATIICVYWRRRGIFDEAALVTVALVFVYMFFYSAMPVAPTLTMIAVGVLWRSHGDESCNAAQPRLGRR